MIWTYLANILDLIELQVTSYMFKLLWKKRNEWVHNSSFLHPTQLIAQATEANNSYLVVKFSYARNTIFLSRPSNLWSTHSWSKPPWGIIKENYDAVQNKASDKIWIGAIICDLDGKVLGSMRAPRNYTMSPLEAKAYGILLTTNFCKLVGFESNIENWLIVGHHHSQLYNNQLEPGYTIHSRCQKHPRLFFNMDCSLYSKVFQCRCPHTTIKSLLI